MCNKTLSILIVVKYHNSNRSRVTEKAILFKQNPRQEVSVAPLWKHAATLIPLKLSSQPAKYKKLIPNNQNNVE